MTRPFHQELEALKQRVAHMAALARTSLLDGVKSLSEGDAKLADQVLARDAEINQLDVSIESTAIDMIALRQPLGRDLRTLGATLKIITYLDRIGRYGYDIAQAAKVLEGRDQPRKPIVIPHMAQQAAKMLDEAIDAYCTLDAAKARAVVPQDELVDALYEQIFRECITFMVEDPRTIGVFAHYILVARHLERVGDNANKIAEKTLYMITGERRLAV